MEQKEINLDTLFANKHAEPTETVLVVKEQKYVDFGRILDEVSYKLPKGYPTIVDGVFTEREEIIIINEALEAEGLSTLPLPEARVAKLAESDIDKILNTAVIRKLSIAKRLVKTNNVIVLHVTGIKKSERSDILKNIATSLKSAKFVNQISTAGAVQGAYNGVPYYIVIKEHVEEKTDTDLKEGMSVVAAGVPNLQSATPENVKVVINSLLAATKDVVGLTESTRLKIIDYLKRLKTKVAEPKIARNLADLK